MPALTYHDAVAGAFDRLKDVGFEHGPSLVNHAPMAAEALAYLGLTDDVPDWLGYNLRVRRYHDAPEARRPISAADEASWRPLLGNFSRVGDWSAMFQRELDERPWRDVLAEWWPRLLPGMSGALTHGVIRTAHAVRAIAGSGTDDTTAVSHELARGLGYWASRYAGTDVPAVSHPGDAPFAAGAESALRQLVVDSAGFYAGLLPSFPIPLIHSITAPAAVLLVCQYLPPEQHWVSYATAQRCSDAIRGYFGRGGQVNTAARPVTHKVGLADVIGAAVETRDEHAIKLAEVAARLNAVTPDQRLLDASYAASLQIARNPF
jgi:hypothetical protein